jgi:starch phosphorylase
MVRDYVRDLYAPAAVASRKVVGSDFSGARELAAWKSHILKAWPGVAVTHVDEEFIDMHVGAALSIRAEVALGALSGSDVIVEVAYGRVDENDSLLEPVTVPLSLSGQTPGGDSLYVGEIPLDRAGPFGYNVRVVPSHPLLAASTEMGLIALPPAPEGLTSGDLR